LVLAPNQNNSRKPDKMTRNIFKSSLIAVLAVGVVSTSLSARDIALVELEIYAAENYRVEYVKLKEEDKTKIKQEYKEKVALATIIRKETINDTLYQAALDFRALDLWSKQIASKTDVSDKVLKELYAKQEIKVAPKYKLRNILVKDESDANITIKELSKLESDKLLKRFGELVKEKSIDKATKDRDGDSGWMDDSVLPKEIIEQIKDKPKLSVIKLANIKEVGAQIILIEDKEPEHLASFEEAKEYLKRIAIQNAITREANKLLGDVKESKMEKPDKAKMSPTSKKKR
jgi:PPIC-type PPIASE domain